MFSCSRFGLTVFAAACMFFCACGTPRLQGTAAGPRQAPALDSLLPLPSALRSASFAPLDLRRLGAEYEHALPSAHVTGDAFHATFAPDLQQPTGEFGSLAYAIYAFNIVEFNLDANLYCDLVAPQDPADAWVALANFSRDRWDWFHLPTGGEPLPFDIAQHMSAAGGMYVVTLFSGTQPWTVAALRIGTVVAPVVSGITPESGVSGTQVTLQADVSGTAPFDYQWYDMAMGTPSTTSESAPVITLGAPGAYSYRLKVSNAAGSMDISRDFQVLPAPVDQWQHSWGGAGADRAQAVAVDDAGNVYVAGAATSFGSDTAAVTLKYSPAGELLWAKIWDGTFTDSLAAIAIDEAGNIHAAGSTMSYGAGWDDLLMLEYAPDGILLSQHTWGGEYQDTAVGLGFDAGGNLYVAGSSASFTPNNRTGALLLKIDSGGDFDWATVWGGQSGNEAAGGLAVDPSGNIYICGGSGSYTDQAYIVEFDAAGAVRRQVGWKTTALGMSYFRSIALDPVLQELYLAGDAPRIGFSEPVIVKYSFGLTVRWARIWSGSGIDHGNGIAYDGAGVIYWTGETNSHGPSPGANLFLIALNSNGTLHNQIATWGIWDTDDRGTLKAEQGRALAVTPDGRPVVAGSCENAYAMWWEDSTTLPGVVGVASVLDAEITPDAQITGVLSVPVGAADQYIDSGYVEDIGVGSEDYAVIYGAPW